MTISNMFDTELQGKVVSRNQAELLVQHFIDYLNAIELDKTTIGLIHREFEIKFLTMF